MFNRGTRATPETRGTEAAAAYRGGQARRPVHVLQVEDLLLGSWVFGVEELMRRWAGEPIQLLQSMTSSDAGQGLLGLLAALTPSGWMFLGLFLFVLLTRGPEDTDRDVALGRRWPAAPALPHPVDLRTDRVGYPTGLLRCP